MLEEKYPNSDLNPIDFLYIKNPIIEMLNLLLLRRGYKPKKVFSMFQKYINRQKGTVEYKRYRDLYDKNKLNLLFQLVSFYKPKQKQYAGFNVFCMLSSGIIRSFLELCYQSFNIALFSNRESLIKKKEMPFINQTEGATIRSESYLEGIEHIPKYGNEIKSLVRALGAIFKSWQDDLMISEPEVTYFSVDFTVLSKEAKDVINSAVQWSILQPKKPMKAKTVTDQFLDVYALNHILAPYFGISYRLRGRIPHFGKNDLEALMFGSEKEKDDAITRLSKTPNYKKQITTLDHFSSD